MGKLGRSVAESHTTYPVLIRFRSPGPMSSWVISLLAVLDSAALFLAVFSKTAPVVPARLCLRGGFRCFNRIAQVMGFDIPDEPAPDAGTSLTYEQFLKAVARMREVGFPIERDPVEPGRTSSDGGSTTSKQLSRWPPRSMPCRRCGQAAPALGAADPAKTSRTRPPTEVINGVTRGRRLAGGEGCHRLRYPSGIGRAQQVLDSWSAPGWSGRL